MIYYYLIIALQIFCIYHVLKNRNEWWWILIILIFPLSALFYIYMKMMNQKQVVKEFSSAPVEVSNIFNSGGNIKELEKKVEFSDTFVNKIALGDAYLVSKMYDEAIPVFESTRKGVHDNDPHVNHQLINAYFHKNDFEQVVRIAERASENKAFDKSNAKVLYALALESLGQIEKAESTLQSMNGQYSDLEPRIIFGQFLNRQNKKEAAELLFKEIIAEGEHMSNFELKNKRHWIQQAKQELKRLQA